MNNLSRNRMLLLIIAVLLITNVAMGLFFFNHHCEPGEQKTPGFSERLRKEVGFTPEQIKIFEPKKKVFWDTMHQRLERLKKTKESFYYQMYDSTIVDSVIDAKAEVIGQEQKEIDMQVLHHFKDLRKLCTPAQLPKFDSLLPMIIQRMTVPPGKK